MSDIVLFFPGKGMPLRVAVRTAKSANCKLMIRLPWSRRFLALPRIKSKKA